MALIPTVGILGGGQLGRMMAFEARRMGFNVAFLVPAPAPPVENLGEVIVDDWYDPQVLRAFAARCDVVTTENEWAPLDVLAQHNPGIPVWPSPTTLGYIRHKGRQKEHLQKAGLPVPDFRNCRTREEAQQALIELGVPAVAKKFEGSYDGYGNFTIRTPEELSQAWDLLAAEDGLLIEAFVPFVRELAILVARRPSGDMRIYPLVWTEQRDHRCYAVMAPAPVDTSLIEQAQALAKKTAQVVDAVGILAIELFEQPDGTLLINELAPRPHNTGHYSIEACYTSQFENHIRAVLDLPLGSPALRTPAAVMINLLGNRTGETAPRGLAEALSIDQVYLHLYGKTDVRPKRKMGHITALDTTLEEARARAEQAASAITL